MSEHSYIYSYDKNTNQRTDIHLNYNYLGGSHDLDWEGVIIEKLYTFRGANQDIYFKDNVFVIAIEDVTFNVNNELIETVKDDVFITPMNSSYEVHITESFPGIMMSLSTDFIKSHFYDKNIDGINFIKNYRIVDNNINYLMKLILEQAQAKANFKDIYLHQLFTAFVTYYINNYSDYHSAEEEHVLNSACLTRIDHYIDQNLSNEVTYKDISSLSGMSNYSFLNEFKSLTSVTPHQYILKRKLKKAQQLLLNSPLTITEISHELGFTDSSHFSNFFKKHMNLAPSQYKEQEQIPKQ